ncbi:hypothetical protein BV20DRAFT_40039 [Pilatotrama ljubarskyi]|nr:hypothetical protein BV20DRAFT_40039 [Pilatotrama ljubarskyi]
MPELSVLDIELKPLCQAAGESSCRFLEKSLSSHSAQLRSLSIASPSIRSRSSPSCREPPAGPSSRGSKSINGSCGAPNSQQPCSPNTHHPRPPASQRVQSWRLRRRLRRLYNQMTVSPAGSQDIHLPCTGAFPKSSEELHCPHTVLPIFLPSDGALRCPIRRVELENSNYWRGGGCQLVLHCHPVIENGSEG